MRHGMRTAGFVSSLSVVRVGANAPAAVASDQAPPKHVAYMEVGSGFTDANIAEICHNRKAWSCAH